uniref:TSPO associated protein 1 n=1 Tax=Kryptolebias marmoratus TaxID=37003 RepID=A0A3Q3ANK3_KRYMA
MKISLYLETNGDTLCCPGFSLKLKAVVGKRSVFALVLLQNGTDYGFLVRQNSELLRALDKLEKTCNTLREENGLLRKSSAPETEEKVRRLRRKNTELTVLAKRLEDRAHKLQEANLKVNSPSLMRPGSVEQYKKAFARQRARDLARHADALLSKDKEIAALQQECRELEERLGTVKCNSFFFFFFFPPFYVQERELSKKRKECENLEHEVKKRQKRCLDLVSTLPHFFPSIFASCKSSLYTRAENEELREDLSEVRSQHNSVLEENQRLRAKLENLEQVLKHMREVAERRQQLELEHEQALAILKFKQDEIKRLHVKRWIFPVNLSSLFFFFPLNVHSPCHIQSEQFGLLSQELEKFRLQASKVDLASSSLLSNPSLSVLANGVGLTTERASASLPPPTTAARHVSHPGCVFRVLEVLLNDPPCPLCCPQADTASEVEELDIDVAPAPCTLSRAAPKLQVFIARYSYNPYDGPNDNPEVELPLTAGEYIYVYGDMDDDGFYEGPPDAPLDVQLEAGPSAGIALISWLPVTIDAAGTSNGVRVTGYTLYADKKKVLEVASPTAGSALLGPSQIQSLQAAQELTVQETTNNSG